MIPSLIKIAVLVLMVSFISAALLGFIREIDITDLTNVKPLENPQAEVALILSDGTKYDRLTRLVDYLTLAVEALDREREAVAGYAAGLRKTGNINEYAELMENFLVRSRVPYFNDNSQLSERELMAFNSMSYRDINGVGVSQKDPAAVIAIRALYLNKPTWDGQFNLSQKSVELAAVSVSKPDEKFTVFREFPPPSYVFSTMDVEAAASLGEKVVAGMKDASEYIRTEIPRLSSKKDLILLNTGVSISRINSTEEIFYTSLFSKMTTAFVTISIIAIGLRQISVELAHMHGLNALYMGLLVSEASTKEPALLATATELAGTGRQSPPPKMLDAVVSIDELSKGVERVLKAARSSNP